MELPSISGLFEGEKRNAYGETEREQDMGFQFGPNYEEAFEKLSPEKKLELLRKMEEAWDKEGS